MYKFVGFFVERSLLAYLMSFSLLILGAFSLATIKRDTFPPVDFQEVSISTYYPGASPEDVELNVTNKIEEALKEVDGIDKYTSVSLENISNIHLNIEQEAKNPDNVKRDIRNAVGRVTDFPSEVKDRPLIKEITTNIIPIIEVGLSGEVPYKELRSLSKRFEKKLLAVKGVSEVKRFGYRNREITVAVDSDKIERFQISAKDVLKAIQGRNIRSSAGSFESYANEKNIVTLAEFPNPLDVGDVIVKSSFDGPSVLVKDLATVLDDFEPETERSRMNGVSAISYLVRKKESADIIRTVDRIKIIIEQEQHKLPQGVTLMVSGDTAVRVSNRLEVVKSNGMLGLLAVLVILIIFLNWRVAFWVSMGIPIALLGTLYFLPMFGVHLDTIGLAAMIIVIGIIVDDAIVVAENISRHYEMGKSPMDAAKDGTNEIILPVLTTILTTILAFAPMFVMTGVMGKFIYVIPLVVVIALSISFLESIFALPAHLRSGMKYRESVVKEISAGLFENVMRVPFRQCLLCCLRLRYFVVFIFIIMLGSSIVYAKKYMHFILFPSQTAEEFHIQVKHPTGTSLAASSDTMIEVENIVKRLPKNELDSFVTRVGVREPKGRGGRDQHWAVTTIYLSAYSQRDRSADEIVEVLRKEMAKLTSIEKYYFYIEAGGPPIGRPISIRVVGSDDQMRESALVKIEGWLKKQVGVKDIERDDIKGKEQFSVKIDYKKLSQLKLSVNEVAHYLRLAYDGEIVSSVRYGDEDVDFRVILAKESRSDVNGLKKLLIPNSDKRLVSLSDFASFESTPGTSNIYHYKGERSAALTGDIEKTLTTPLLIAANLAKEFDFDKEWPELEIMVTGEAEETDESMSNLMHSFITAAVGILFVLMLLFNSVTKPLIVMAVIPFGLIGVIISFGLHDASLGFVAMLGVIGLSGVLVNDSLILVNVIGELECKNPQNGFFNAVVVGASARLRAILITSLTTCAGLLPMAYGLGGDDPMMAPMALAMGWGILFATPLALILIPCLLVIHRDIEILCAALASRAMILLRVGASG